MILQTNDYSINYGHVKAVKSISFNLNKGEIISIIGANGAGKTSTLFGLAGIVKSEGKIIYKDKDISNSSYVQRVKEGLILCPENRRIFPELTVEENLKMGAYRRGNFNNNIGIVHDLFPILKERKRQVSGYLSGGEQQMLAIGRALMADPEVFMLDEPSLGLAPILTDEVFKSLSKLKDRGISVILVEQNAVKALKLSDRAYIMETGKIVLSGLSKNLLNDVKVKEAYLGI